MCTTKLISCCPRFKMLWTGKPSSVAMTNICFGVRQACQQVEQALPTFGKTDATLGGGGGCRPGGCPPPRCSVSTAKMERYALSGVMPTEHLLYAKKTFTEHLLHGHCSAKNFSWSLSFWIQNNTMHSIYYDYSHLLMLKGRLRDVCTSLRFTKPAT